MSVSININGLTLCHRGSGGVTHNTLPDVCKTPDKAIPIPYQNEAYSRDLAKGTTSVFADGGNMIANLGSNFAKSVFDEAGSMGGVVSGTNKAEAEWITHSFDVFFQGKPACRLTDKMFMNHRNTVNLAGENQPDHLSDKCKRIWQAIYSCIYTVRPPTLPGGFPQGPQGLATRWREAAENTGNRGGKFAQNHLEQYGRDQKKLKEELERWDKNKCGDDDLPPGARQYAAQQPEYGPGKPTVPDMNGPSWLGAAGKTAGIILTIIILSRVVRAVIPFLWPLQLSSV